MSNFPFCTDYAPDADADEDGAIIDDEDDAIIDDEDDAVDAADANAGFFNQ